jgi:hypothetical protein
MAETLAALLKDFGTNPIGSVKARRGITYEYGDDVVDHALPLLKVAEDGRGLRYLLELLLTRKLILSPLCHPSVFSLEEAVRLAMILRHLDSLLGLSLANDRLRPLREPGNPSLHRMRMQRRGMARGAKRHAWRLLDNRTS